MALKFRLRSKRSNRLGYVAYSANSKSTNMNISSSDSETEENINRTKVRKGLSIKNLMREAKTFGVDGDHIYASGKSQGCSFEDDYQPFQEKRRKISENISEKPCKQKSFTKNALMARLNRERKKKYVSSLESDNENLQKQNKEFQQKIEEQNTTVSALKREILYLKGLLANSKELGQILQNLKSTTNLPVTSSMIITEKNNCSSEECTSEVQELHQPRIRSIKSGCNFPIMDKDINLGSSSDRSLSFSDFGDLESPLFDFDDVNLNSEDLDLHVDNILESNESRKDDKTPEVGICLHVNNKRISVEICSICNSKANSSILSDSGNVV